MPATRSFDRCQTARILDEVLPELARGLDDPALAPTLREAFLGALGSLARYRFTDVDRLCSGEEGLELLNELVVAVLSGVTATDPRQSGSRVVANAGYRLLRRPRLRRAELEPDATASPSGPSARTEAVALTPTSRELRDRLDGLPLDELCKGSGRLHLTEVGRCLGLPVRVLRDRLRRLGRELGRDREYQEFWFARLADAVHELLRERTEQELPDLCGTRPSVGPAILRLRHVLERFTSLGGERSFASGLRGRERKRRALRWLRRLSREQAPCARALLAAARLLQPDHPRFALIQAERLRAAGRAGAALRVLGACEPADPEPRTRLLFRLARARCLERLGRPGEASDLLERHAPEHRGDALYDYNRHVLALHAGESRRAHRALSDLRRREREHASLSPLLRRGIRLALAAARG